MDAGATSDSSPQTAYFVATVTPDTYESGTPSVNASPVEIEGDGDGEDSFLEARDVEYEAKFNRKVNHTRTRSGCYSPPNIYILALDRRSRNHQSLAVCL